MKVQVTHYLCFDLRDAEIAPSVSAQHNGEDA